MGLGIIRLERNCFPIFGNSTIDVTTFRKKRAEVFVSFGRTWLQLDRFAKLRDSSRSVAFGSQRPAPLVVDLRVVLYLGTAHSGKPKAYQQRNHETERKKIDYQAFAIWR